ncbi:hypothetical protein IE077_000845 [Cardiosporidium cionae]|uniref:TFIIS N-terminal domain-containing protein n=1 Tax=Cardiosporidium cionae TaxID=476202 RepID=A0ABQ7JDU0_9APIC|nr:hypothetical protein IE077_000845 [Cardiosporidium cionae]|eukprot:KAF8822192.1 hypothetical protein IE077_000845 [Cardiosporidium cionae]
MIIMALLDIDDENLTRQDFRILKHWYDENFKEIMAANFKKENLSEKVLEDLMIQNGHRQFHPKKMDLFLRIRMQQSEARAIHYKRSLSPAVEAKSHQTVPLDVRKSGVSLASSHSTAATPSSSVSCSTTETFYNQYSNGNLRVKYHKIEISTEVIPQLLALTKYEGSGGVKKKEDIKKLVTLMKLCKDKKSKALSLGILKCSAGVPGSYNEFVKHGGVEVIKTWLELMAKMTGINAWKDIAVVCLDILSQIDISIPILKSSQIGKPVNFIVRASRLSDECGYFCNDRNIVSMANQLVRKWRMLYATEKRSVEKRQINASTKEKKLATGSPSISVDPFPKNASHSSITMKKPDATSQLPASNFLTDLLGVVEEEVEKQKRRKKEYQIAKREGEKRELTALRLRKEEQRKEERASVLETVAQLRDTLGIRDISLYSYPQFSQSPITNVIDGPLASHEVTEDYSTEELKNCVQYAYPLIQWIVYPEEETTEELKERLKTDTQRGNKIFPCGNDCIKMSHTAFEMARKEHYSKGGLNLKNTEDDVQGSINEIDALPFQQKSNQITATIETSASSSHEHFQATEEYLEQIFISLKPEMREFLTTNIELLDVLKKRLDVLETIKCDPENAWDHVSKLYQDQLQRNSKRNISEKQMPCSLENLSTSAVVTECASVPFLFSKLISYSQENVDDFVKSTNAAASKAS